MSPAHPSELALERHLLDPAASPVKAHVEGCDRCAARLAEMRRQGDEFLQFVFPATVEKVEEAAVRGAGRFRWLQLFAPASALAAAAAVFLLVRPAGPGLEVPGDWDGVKGTQGLGLAVFLQAQEGAHAAREAEAVRPDAALRFRVQPTRPCHLLLLSVDAAGQVSRLYPPNANEAAPLIATRYEVPGGAVLDGKSGPERVFAFCSQPPVDFGQVERALQSAVGTGASGVRANRVVPGLPDGTGQVSVLLEKR